jgi:hypothetical protein
LLYCIPPCSEKNNTKVSVIPSASDLAIRRASHSSLFTYFSNFTCWCYIFLLLIVHELLVWVTENESVLSSDTTKIIAIGFFYLYQQVNTGQTVLFYVGLYAYMLARLGSSVIMIDPIRTSAYDFDTCQWPLLHALKCHHWFDAVAVSAEVNWLKLSLLSAMSAEVN